VKQAHTVALVLLLSTVLLPVASHAQTSGPFDDDEDVAHDGSTSASGEVEIGLSGSGSSGQPAVSASFDDNGNATIVSNVTSIKIRKYREAGPEDPNFQGGCIGDAWVSVPRGQVEVMTAAYQQALDFDLQSLFPNQSVDVPSCLPVDAPADAEDPMADVLARFVEQLPRPEPDLNPGPAITGLDTYLETNRPLSYGPVNDTMDLGGQGFPVTLWAEGSYTVDWGQQDQGDGPAFQRVSGPHTVPGRPYEEHRPVDAEAVTHVYTTIPADTLSISVTDTWTIHYSIEGVVEDATIVAELEPVTVPLDVIEYQAVVIEQ
jgi:hypothetical protein